MKKKSNNQKKETWYPVLRKDEMRKVLRAQGIFSWLDTTDITKPLKLALEEDVLEFVNRACRAVYIAKTKIDSKLL